MSEEQANPLQGYYDWQVNTLMLARDLSEPVEAGNEQQALERRQQIEQEVREMTLAVLPDEYRQDPNRDWPPSLFMDITKVTLMRAARWAGIVEESE